MLNYSFFDSVIGPDGQPDRAFGAGDFSKYFGTLIKNGIFPNPSSNFQIIGDQNNMTVKAEAGLAWINGHLAYDDGVFILNIDKADSALDRIDRIILRLDTLERCIKWIVKKGDLSSNPVAKSLQRDADAYEIAIADVRVGKGVSKITQSSITDLRMNTELCGWVTGTVTQIDTSTLFNQLEQWKSEYISESNNWTTEQRALFLAWVKQFETDSSTWKTEQEELFENWSATEKNKFDEWLKSVKDALSGDVAGNLLTKINKNSDDIASNKNEINSIRGKIQDMQLLASNWIGSTAPFSYTLEIPNSTAKSTVEILPSESITQEHVNTFTDALIQAAGQGAGTVTLKAWGNKPSINLPIKVILRAEVM